MLLILRFARELVDPDQYKLPEGKLGKWKISTREVAMAYHSAFVVRSTPARENEKPVPAKF